MVNDLNMIQAPHVGLGWVSISFLSSSLDSRPLLTVLTLGVALKKRGQSLLCAGDMPIVLTQDGPSFGGFVCPCTITSTEIWKMGQVSPNDRVHFKPTTIGRAPQGR